MICGVCVVGVVLYDVCVCVVGVVVFVVCVLCGCIGY